MQLRDYQEKGIYELAYKLSKGKRKILRQLATGGGKTVEFCAIIKRYLEKNDERILILVHRDRLLKQTETTLKNWYGIEAQLITKETKHVYDRKVYIGMVETLFRRLNKSEYFLPKVGLVIMDEAHLGNHKKLHEFFSTAMVIGFTATPEASDRRDPLKNYFEDIVVGPPIKHLIEIGSLCQNYTYSPKNVVKRASLKVRMGEFDDKTMAEEFSKLRHIKNTVLNYIKYAIGKKTIVYNCNIEHSILVTEEFRRNGFKCQHIDGTFTNEEKQEIYDWFESTSDAILCNVDIATIGYDFPTIGCIIVNLATMSLTKWLQMVGRGSRPCKEIGKTTLTTLDMGDNARAHGLWETEHDWEDKFYNPKLKRDKLDAAPMKDCPNCGGLIAAQAMTCVLCGFEFPKSIVDYDKVEIELALLTKNLDIERIVEETADKKEYYSLFKIMHQMIAHAKRILRGQQLTDKMAEGLVKEFQDRTKEWCRIKGKKFNYFHKKVIAEEKIYEELFKEFGYKRIAIENLDTFKSKMAV